MRISDWSSDVCSSDLGSRAFINDQACSAALLREIGAYLVEIHGQHDDRGLLNPRGHRALLDAFGKCATATVPSAHGAWRTTDAALAEARGEVENAERARAYLETCHPKTPRLHTNRKN